MLYKNITVHELKAMRDRGDAFVLLDIREPFERELAHIGGLHLPMGQLGQRWNELERNLPIVIYCHHGVRSRAICQALSAQAGFENLYNLLGGIDAWSSEIDPNVPVY